MLPARHVIHQGKVVRSLGGTALAALLQKVRPNGAAPPALPAPELVQTIPPLPADLIRDYLRHVGGDPGAYRGQVPAHLFPQWGFPLAARTLRGLPYPLLRVLNGGCRLEIRQPLLAGEPLRAAARLESIDDDGRRAVLCQRVTTGTAADPEMLVAWLYAIVPLKSGGGSREPARVPSTARELAYWRLPADAGLAFAMLTGDFNPVHWVQRYARASGFRSVILHGFATMARAIEGLNRGLWAGATDRLRTFDCRFTRPLLLPARVGLYVDGGSVWVGDAPGGPAYLTGTFEGDSR